MNTSREKYIKYFVLDKIIRENKRKFKEEINSENYYKYYKNNKLCDSEVHKCFINKYEEAKRLVSSDRQKYIEVIDDIVKLLDIGGYDDNTDNYKKYYQYVRKKILLLLDTGNDSDTSSKNNVLDVYGGNGGVPEEDVKKDVVDVKKDEEEDVNDRKKKIIDFIEELTEINSELENKERDAKNYENISDSIDKKFDEFKKYNNIYIQELNRKPISNYDNQFFNDIKDNIIEKYLNFLKSNSGIESSYIENIGKLNNELLKVNLYIDTINTKSNIYNKYKKINVISNEIIKKSKSKKGDNNYEYELNKYTENINRKINEIFILYDSLVKEIQYNQQQQPQQPQQPFNNSRQIIDNIDNIKKNVEEIIKNGDTIYKKINEVRDLIKKSILLKNISESVKEYIEELNKNLKNIDKKKGNSISDVDIENNNIYNKIWNMYVKNINDNEKVLQDSQDKLYREFEFNNLDPSSALKLTLEDKLIFIVVCFCIRQIVLSIMGYMYDKNMINSFYLAIIYYVCFYIAIILIIVIIVNLDDYNLRIILNFFNLNANMSGIIMHVIIMILLAITIYHLAYLIMPSIHKNYIKNEIIDDVSKYKIVYDIELTTISMFFMTSLITFYI
jgi:hypothetical protein